MLACRWIAAASFCALIGCASKAPPALPLAEQWVETEVPQVGVKFSRPVAWKVAEDSTPSSIHFTGVDDHSTQIGLTSAPTQDPKVTAEQRLTETMEAYRVPSTEVVLEDSRRQIAGCPASIFITESTKTGFKVRVMLVYFYSPKYDYRLSVAGEADFFDDVRPKVMKMIDSMRLIELKKDSN